MVQIITNNALVCKVVGLLLEVEFPHLFLDPLCGSYFEPQSENIYVAKNADGNENVFRECGWITFGL